tara:strand:- start:2540 stop:2935 length:396 start_codon:yes stop_codon:yes gene_type:complete
MGDLTKNLSRHEFECECGCGFDTVDFLLVDWLQKAVEHFSCEFSQDVYVVITGGNRCPEHNEVIGGSANSQHIYGRAADHKFYFKDSKQQIDPEIVAEYYEEEYPNICGLGRYHNRTHIDCRGSAARWGKS